MSGIGKKHWEWGQISAQNQVTESLVLKQRFMHLNKISIASPYGYEHDPDFTLKLFVVFYIRIYHECEGEIITIHHERPCRIEISHPRGRKLNQGRGLPSPWLNSDPEGEISLSYMDRLMMDRFSPTFRRVFIRT